MDTFVLDSYALLAFFGAETGGEQVRQLIVEAKAGKCRLFMSVVNLGEVLYILERGRGLPFALQVAKLANESPIEFVDAGRAQVTEAAHIKAHWPVAYADCFVVALAQLKGAAVVTGDPEFRQLEEAEIVPVVWIGEP